MKQLLRKSGLIAAGLALATAGSLALNDQAGLRREVAAVSHVSAADEWGAIKGQVVFAGAEVPKVPPKNVGADKEHCLKEGDPPSDKWIVSPKNKGLRYAVVYLKFKEDVEIPVHPDLAKPAKPEAVLDQPFCRFDPHVLAMRQDQKLKVLNPAPIAHNIRIQGFGVDKNTQIAPGKHAMFEIKAEDNPISLSCGAHAWMGGVLWVFEHPYFAVTDADGHFAIEKVPAGAQKLMIWYEEVGYVTDKSGKVIDVKAGGETDLGKFEVMPPKPK